MPPLIVQVLFCGLLMVAGATAHSAAPALDLEACIRHALEHRGRIQAAGAAHDAAVARIGQTRSARRPQLSAEAGLSYIDRVPQIGNALSSALIDTDRFQPEPLALRERVQIEQVLYAGGRIQAALRASQFLAESVAWQEAVAREETIFETRQAFNDALLSDALVAVADESLAVFERHQSDAQQLLESGVVSKIVLLRADTEVAARAADLESATAARTIAYLNLARVVGRPQEEALALDGNFDTTPVVLALPELLRAAFANRPELKAIDAGLEAARANVDRARAAYRPRVAARAQYQNTDGGGALQPDGWSVTVGAEIDLYMGGRRKHRVREAEAELARVEAERNDVAQLVEFDVRQALIRVNEADTKITRETATVTLAEEALRLAEVRFREEVGTPAEVLDAELALTQARTALARARRDYAVARAGLDKAAATGDWK